MKKIFAGLLITTLLACSHNNKTHTNETPNIVTVDSTATNAVLPKPSAEELSVYFSEQKTTRGIFIQAKGLRLDGNGVYCYFTMNGRRASGLRLRIQYWDEKYGNVNFYKFDVDGEIYEYSANKERLGDGIVAINSSVSYYWYDNTINKKDQAFLEAVSKGKNVKLSLIEANRNKLIATITLSDKDKANIGRTLDYYFALDGKKIPREGMVNIRG